MFEVRKAVIVNASCYQRKHAEEERRRAWTNVRQFIKEAYVWL